jgi:hypothetical protein
MPGNAFVAGSESGFVYSETMEGIEESDVIYLDNYNGKRYKVHIQLLKMVKLSFIKHKYL